MSRKASVVAPTCSNRSMRLASILAMRLAMWVCLLVCCSSSHVRGCGERRNGAAAAVSGGVVWLGSGHRPMLLEDGCGFFT
ncbi:UNVERIFIED_CONTAM: hypothetical protein Sangu_2037500 [Sesamum angustifolium]|uniref:Secreted protein n=1 Tax=Sesamum angustifolium TaxID=2727405 RepID=A0AAW2LIP9_9LAMI